jgi:uncharacterized protein (UPF0332 family)
MTTGIARAREELFAAHLLATTGFAAQSVGLSFRAALAAAEAALLLIDRVPNPVPAAVVSAFVSQVVRGRGLDPETGRRLRSLLNRAEQAHVDGAVPQQEAPAAIADATEVVDAVAKWIDESNRVAGERAESGKRVGKARARPSRPR